MYIMHGVEEMGFHIIIFLSTAEFLLCWESTTLGFPKVLSHKKQRKKNCANRKKGRQKLL